MPDSAAPTPRLKLAYLSHGTLESKDLERSRKFYEEFLGLEVVRTSPISLLIRLGGTNTIAVVQSSNKAEMTFLNHNGIDVATQQEVDAAHRVIEAEGAAWGVHKLTRPALQHGTYCFYFWDCDDNAWEILSNPPGGYSWLFERGDQEGRGHLDKNFARPDSTSKA
jgi:catechol 2,3-dioxygenase-like lactoylglutathione lyase family enzyme